MTWLYKGEPYEPETAPEEYKGFVYRITNLSDGMKYIGKKFFWSVRKLPPLKGKKRKRTVTKESDWRTYFGSNAILKEEALRLGTDNYLREILHMCETKGACSYWEAKLQFEHDVILREDYHNQLIMCRINSTHLKGLIMEREEK